MKTSNVTGHNEALDARTTPPGEEMPAEDSLGTRSSRAPRRVLLVGQATFDRTMDSYRRALAPFYELEVIDPLALMADMDTRVLGERIGSQVHRVVATLSRLVLSGEIALAEPRIRRVAASFAPDLIVTDCIDFLRPALIAELRKSCPDAKIIGLFSDHLLNVQRGYCFVADYDRLFFKDRHIVEKFRAKLRSKSVFYLPQCFDRKLHRRVELTEQDRRRYGCDIAIYGNGYMFRAASLELLVGRDIKVWGGGLPRWAVDHPTAPLFTGHFVTGEEKCRAMLASKIALNANHFAEIAGTNKRTFELAGMGAFQLTDTPALADVFEPNVEVARYETADDLDEMLDHYLARPDLRAVMADRAMARAQREHTYEHRWTAILEILEMQTPRDFPVQPADLTVRAQ